MPWPKLITNYNHLQNNGATTEGNALHWTNLAKFTLPYRRTHDQPPPRSRLPPRRNPRPNRVVHRSRSDGSVFPGHARTLCSTRRCGTHCPPSPNRLRAPHKVSTRVTAHGFCANNNQNNRGPSAVGRDEKRPMRATCPTTSSLQSGGGGGEFERPT